MGVVSRRDGGRDIQGQSVSTSDKLHSDIHDPIQHIKRIELATCTEGTSFIWCISTILSLICGISFCMRDIRGIESEACG